MRELAGLDVSRETIAKFESFAALVGKWNGSINLVSKSTLPDLWERHIVDSAQIMGSAPPFHHWVDFGSGGGFPGIVVAILSESRSQDTKITMIESDHRKSVFLRTAIRELGLPASVISKRIDFVEQQGADVVSARALADLNTLLGFAKRHMSPTGTALFPKGSRWREEHSAAQANWVYQCEAIQSMTNSDAAILKIKDISRV